MIRDTPIRVLLLDDDQQDFVIVQRMLDKVKEPRFHVDWAETYEEGRQALAMQEHDAYLIDYRVGADNGLDLLKETFHNGVRKPMIVLTAHSDAELDMRVIQMGAADFLPKRELSPTLLGRTIRHAIERNQMMEKLYFQATHDELTGLHNRKYCMEQLNNQIASALRHKFPISLCLCDIDFFKEVNDGNGHQVGDQVLAGFGQILSEQIRTEDLPSRYGGDEFCIIFPHSRPEEAAISVERVRAALQKRTFESVHRPAFKVTASFGIAQLSRTVTTTSELISAADKALYKAKHLGRNRYAIHNDE